MIKDGHGGLYEWCRRCGALVKLNKRVFGSLHVCDEPYVPPLQDFYDRPDIFDPPDRP